MYDEIGLCIVLYRIKLVERNKVKLKKDSLAKNSFKTKIVYRI